MRAKKTYEEIEEIAKKYTTLKEFIKNDKSAYTISASNGWLDKFTWLERKNNKWTKESCEAEARKYKTISEFITKNSSAYKAAKKKCGLRRILSLWISGNLRS